MLISLCGYFDLGASYGLSDDAFRVRGKMVPNIDAVGLRHPLGYGLSVPIGDDLLARWREIALTKANNPFMELGFDVRDPDAVALQQKLEHLIRTHPITAQMTIYAVGTCFIRFDIQDGLPLRLARGFAKCFEYAAYTPVIAEALLDCATEGVRKTGADRYASMQNLSQRPVPERQYDESGNEERMLIPSFTYVVRRTAPTESVQALMQAIAPETYETVDFEFHGRMHFSWAACVLEPRDFDDPDETPVGQMERMMWCIQIAHCFFATCEAFEALTLNETLSHADAFIKGEALKSKERDLNRLRTLALAVNSMTSYEQITATEEDHKYFQKWERHAKIANRHATIANRCEVLYNVQDAEKQARETRRSRLLSDILFILTGITLIGFLTGAYDFIRDQEQWLATAGQRAVALGLMAVILYVISRTILARSDSTRPASH